MTSTHSSLPSSVSPLLLLSSSSLVPFFLSCTFPSTLHLFPVFLFFFLIKKKISFFFFGHKTCEIFPRPGIEHAPSALEAQILNHWTARDVPQFPCCWFFPPLFSLAFGLCSSRFWEAVPSPFLLRRVQSAARQSCSRIGTIWA